VKKKKFYETIVIIGIPANFPEFFLFHQTSPSWMDHIQKNTFRYNIRKIRERFGILSIT